MTEELKPLASLAAGASAVVRSIDISPAYQTRLMELGLLACTRVELVRYAPLGDPVEIRVRGYHLTLRRHEAEKVMVSTIPETV
jgi:ferrous iron transport protein A